jgi:hypothetical protein
MTQASHDDQPWLATGALGLYERAGFTVDHTSVTHAKPLLP